ncbi:non-heme chloroperoxidase [Tolypothrix tenuis PCC 7101]|uniref:Non-heme chloroperoxidase n=1 Tax=Tolypothrix tenuis PCC 7101 TaxID=231146 RepID=A0A1Z4NA94_9CYAN|nr:alpha/beta hydrolase [Aulosira sp. FACHB-113]BAZ02659.1 non-heme chloroperoxidase [Tolypothrix tenuis PCC 7101]BAZ78448.1 non-heme chloroperoxidase [Aulosira laxa NIES-50]
MPYVTVGQENSASIDIYYEDFGVGQPVVLIHGFPLSGHSWEKQVGVLLKEGYRVITYDRRGFGDSSQPSFGYDYDTFASDLDTLMTKLDLRNAVLIGFSMGTGEVTRYLGKYGSERVSKAVLMGPVPPFLLKTNDNPEGVPQDIFDGIMKAIAEDRPAYLSTFLKDFFNVDVFLGDRISNEAIQMSWNVAAGASAKATLDCVPSWLTDFRDDLPRIDVPTLIIHGDADRLLPLESTAARLPKLIKNSQLVVIPGGPHAINWTHADQVNPVLLDFLKEN